MLPVLMSKAFRIVYLHTGTKITPTRMQKKSITVVLLDSASSAFFYVLRIMEEIGFLSRKPATELFISVRQQVRRFFRMIKGWHSHDLIY